MKGDEFVTLDPRAAGDDAGPDGTTTLFPTPTFPTPTFPTTLFPMTAFPTPTFPPEDPEAADPIVGVGGPDAGAVEGRFDPWLGIGGVNMLKGWPTDEGTVLDALVKLEC